VTVNQPQFIHYLPIATTLLSAIFAVILLNRYRTRKQSLHLLWWGMGVVAYGIGTGIESSITLLGNSVALTKAWYVAGALFGGYPLAQGTAYLLLERKTADRLTAITLPFILLVAVLVFLSPVVSDALEPIRPSGSILAWTWVRALTPIINLYAVVFLVGGAILSAYRFWRSDAPGHGQRAIGNGLIAFGAILPAIGGTMAKMGYVEALYLGEFVGLLFIWTGFVVNIRAARPSVTERNSAAPAAAAG
jgi:hypothetical protein